MLEASAALGVADQMSVVALETTVKALPTPMMGCWKAVPEGRLYGPVVVVELASQYLLGRDPVSFSWSSGSGKDRGGNGRPFGFETVIVDYVLCGLRRGCPG